jgi:hypothetical protein
MSATAAKTSKFSANCGIICALCAIFSIQITSGLVLGLDLITAFRAAWAPSLVTTAIGTLLAVIVMKLAGRKASGIAIIASVTVVAVVEIAALLSLSTPATLPTEMPTQTTKDKRPFDGQQPIDLSDPDKK